MPQTIFSGRYLMALLAALTMLAGAQVWAANGEAIKQISIIGKSGEPAADTTFALSRIASQPGTPVDVKTVSDDVRSLLDSKRYSYVGTRVDETADGVILVFIVEPRLRLTGKTTFSGLHAFTYDKAMGYIDLKAGDFVDEEILGAAAERLRRKYTEKRYYNAKIRGTLTEIPGSQGSVTMSFEIDEGDRRNVNFIEVKGNKAISTGKLRRQSGQYPWWNPVGWFATERVSDFDLEVVRSDMQRQYLDIGYLDVQVSEPEKKIVHGELNITFTVDEGELFSVGAIEFEGVTLFPESDILRSMTLRPGMTAGMVAIRASETALREYFTSRGYVDTRVQTTTYPEPGKPGVINVVYSVKESERAKVGEIMIRGNKFTKDKVIRREISLSPGDVYDGVQQERSKKRLQNLGYFSDVRSYDVEADREENVRDLIFEVAEKNTGSLMFGAGFSSIDHLVGMFEISQSNFDISNFRNFRGAGQKARLSVQGSKNSTDFDASFIEPWFLDRRLSLNVDAFLRNRSYREYDEQRYGGSVGLAKHVPWIGRVGLSYTLQNVSMEDVMDDVFFLADDPSTEFRYTDEDDDYLLGGLRLSWTYDTRDNPMVPHTGTKVTVAGTLYNGAFLSDHDFYELDAQIRHYIPLWYNHVLSLSLRGGVVDTYGSEDYVPIGNRYFLGGGRRARGFKYRDIGPKAIPEENPDSGYFRPVGGQTILEGSVEYSIPIVKFVRVAAFYDFGNVWADPYDFDVGEYASSIGGGFRLDMPGFPIRLDYAEALESDDDLSRERSIVFWIGFDN